MGIIAPDVLSVQYQVWREHCDEQSAPLGCIENGTKGHIIGRRHDIKMESCSAGSIASEQTGPGMVDSWFLSPQKCQAEVVFEIPLSSVAQLHVHKVPF